MPLPGLWACLGECVKKTTEKVAAFFKHTNILEIIQKHPGVSSLLLTIYVNVQSLGEIILQKCFKTGF